MITNRCILHPSRFTLRSKENVDVSVFWLWEIVCSIHAQPYDVPRAPKRRPSKPKNASYPLHVGSEHLLSVSFDCERWYASLMHDHKRHTGCHKIKDVSYMVIPSMRNSMMLSPSLMLSSLCSWTVMGFWLSPKSWSSSSSGILELILVTNEQ